MLMASAVSVVFRLSWKDASAKESLGDSYAFGIAGTGGTSSWSSATML